MTSSPVRRIYFLSLNMIPFVPYAYGFLRAWADTHDDLKQRYTWMEPFCRIEPVEAMAEAIKDPDILCLSSYVWNHNHQLAVAREVKAHYPECRVIAGGPHVPDDDPGYLENHLQVDILVHGEGEIAMSALLKTFLEDEPDLDAISGISYRKGSEIVKAPPGEALPKDLPIKSPYLSGYFDTYLATAGPNRIALWETNRGCPFACCFCDWGVRTRNRMRLHDMGKIEQEIDYMGQNGIEDIYITDSNFGLFKRDLDIARLLVAMKDKTGFPRRVRIQFSKKTNDTVLDISKLLHANDMLWGTTLSMQSVDVNVLEAVNRPYVSIADYQAVKEEYARNGIPTYTELILGLPKETRSSFIKGICTLFSIGMHDDFRVFELALLPNAPLSRPDLREKYGLVTRQKPVRMAGPGCEIETVELVFGSSTLTTEDWAFCLLFAETAQALHNGGYTRFIACYLDQAGLMDYETFYQGLLKTMLVSERPSFECFGRVLRLIQDFFHDPDMPQVNRILTQPDMVAFLGTFNPDRRGWQLWTYLWLWVSENADCFYDGVTDFFASQGIAMDTTLTSLMEFQKQIMITLEYDPETGKTVTTDHNWIDHFFGGKPLTRGRYAVRYGDRAMGASHRYELAKGDKKKFVTAALGFSYPYSKFRHFFHQPDAMVSV